jgi:ribulose-phosphate 3-epimerase
MNRPGPDHPPRLKVAPSVLAADFSRLAEEIARVEEAGAELLHLDVMDGAFVPNISFGIPVIEAIRKVTGLHLQTHLMIEKPERYISDYRKAGSDEIIVHEEASAHLHRTLQMIRDSGAGAGVALNVHTPLDVLEWVGEEMDSLLLMTVNPGFGGQSFIGAMLPKIRRARQMLPGIDIIVDGGVDQTTISSCAEAGASTFVAGTSVFRHSDGSAGALQALNRTLGV